MKLYWSNKDIPELANLSPKQRGKAWRACYLKYAFRYWQTWLALVLIFVFVAIGNKLAGVVGSALGAGIGGFLLFQLVASVVRPHLREFVNRQLPH
jgi:hypothetical protein